ncbi:MAG: hypothetical protein V4544_05010 [Pseudomonadota bacterium]
MNIINKTRLIHLGNTTYIAKETHLSPKFWPKCAAVISSMAVMEANATPENTLIDTSATQAIVLSNKISTSNTTTPASLTFAGTGVKIIDNDNSLINDGDITTPAPTYTAGHGVALTNNLGNPFSGPAYLTGGTLAITNGGALGGSGGGLVVLANGTTLRAMTNNQAVYEFSAPDTANDTATYTLPNPIQLGLTASQYNAINGSGGVNEANAAATITADTGMELTLTGPISESAAAAVLTIAGAGTTVLAPTAANTYTGGTTVGGMATLQLNNSDAIPATGTVTLGNGATLQSTAAATLANSASNATSTSDGILLSGNAVIDVKTSSTLTTTINKVIGGGSSGAHKALTTKNSGTGVGELVLANTANVTTGQYINLIIDPKSVVSVADDTNIPGGTLTLNGGKLLASTGYSSSKALTMADNSYIGSGSGTLAYTGAITDASSPKILHIYSGTVSLGSDYSLNTNTNLQVDGGATLSIASATHLTGGTLTLAGAGGTLKTTAVMTIEKAIALTAGASTIDVTGTLTLTEILSGAAVLTKTGSGTLVLSSTSNSTDTNTSLNISAGTVTVAADTNIPGGTLTLNGGKLHVTGTSSAKAFTMANDSYIGGNFTHSGDIIGAGSAKNLHIYTGTVTFDNNHTNDTNTANTNLVIDNGATLSIGAANNLTGGTLTLAGGTLAATATIATLGKAITLTTGASTIDVAPGTTLTENLAISGAQTLSVTSSDGTGTLVLSGTNYYTNSSDTTGDAGLTITSGIVSVANDTNIPGGTLTLNGGKLHVTGTSSAKAFTMANDSYIGGNFTHSGDIIGAGSAKNLHIYRGTVTFDNDHTNDTNTANTNLVIDNGATLSIGAANNLTGGTFTLNGGTLLANGSTPFTLGKSIALTDASTISVTNQKLTANQPISESYTLEKTSAGTLALTANNSNSTTALKITDGVVEIGTATALPGGVLTLNGGTLSVTAVISGISSSSVAVTAASTINTSNAITLDKAITFTYGLTVSGGGSVTLNQANSGAGGITVADSGTLILKNNNDAAGSGAITLGNGAELELDINSGGTIANSISMAGSATLTATQDVTFSGPISSGGDLTINGAGHLVTLSGSNSYTGTTTLGAGATLSVSAGNQLSSAPLIMGNGSTIRITGGGFSLPPIVL